MNHLVSSVQPAAAKKPSLSEDDWRKITAPVLIAAFGGCAWYLWKLHLRFLFHFDSVNFALSLERFNVGLHQPQPPGYPGFVLLIRMLHAVIADPILVFFFSGLIGLALAVVLIHSLGKAMSSAKTGLAAAILLMFNPAMLSSVDIAPVRTFLAVTSCAVALPAWRLWSAPGGTAALYAGWALLGLLTSFRPELAAILFPILAVASVRYRRPLRQYAIAALLCALGILVWLIPTAEPVGGILLYGQLLKDFFAFQARYATLVNSRGGTDPVWTMAAKALGWIFMGCMTWIWCWPLTRLKTGDGSAPPQRDVWWFLLLWFAPGVLFHCVLHISVSGHALAEIAATCVLGGMVIGRVRPRSFYGVCLGAALALNIYLFKHPLRAGDEASAGNLRWINAGPGAAFRQLQALPKREPLFFVAADGMLSWRTLHYYFPNVPMLVLEPGLIGDCQDCDAFLPSKDRVLPVRKNAKIPACGTIVWMVADQNRIAAQLMATRDRASSGPILVTRGQPQRSAHYGDVLLESSSDFCPGSGDVALPPRDAAR